MVPRITPSSISVRFARTPLGSRNNGTPLAMASTPVSALHPAEKAFRISSTVTAFSPDVGSCEVPSCGSFRPRGWIRPTAMMASSPTMNTMVGSRNARAASPSPRRFASVIRARKPRHSGTVPLENTGNADCSAATPAAMETATVRV